MHTLCVLGVAFFWVFNLYCSFAYQKKIKSKVPNKKRHNLSIQVAY